MIAVNLVRFKQGDSGTFGALIVAGLFECYTGELPWVDLDENGKRDPERSRIVPGVYRCSWTVSASRKNPNGSPEYTYRLESVPDAEGILIHSGNFCGDVTKGYISDVAGCIILGRAVLDLEVPTHKRKAMLKQEGVSSSRETVAAFVDLMCKRPFELTIKEDFK